MVQHMKWWGWGDEQVTFTHEDKPDLAPFVREKIGIDLDGPRDDVIDFDALTIDDPIVTDAFGDALAEVLRRSDHVGADGARRPHLRQEPARPAPGAARRPRPAAGRDRVPGDRRRRRRDHVGGVGHDVVVIPFGGGTNISESLERPRGGDPHRRLRRHAEDGRGDRDRRRRAARPGAGGRARSAPRGAAQREGLDVRPLPGQLHVLDARRLDRHPLVGDAVRQVRRHRGHHDRVACGHARGRAGDARGAVEVDRARREPDDAGERGSARDHHRGDGAGAPGAGEPQDPRLPLPGLVRRDLRHGRDRGERGIAVGHPRRGPARDRSSRSRRRSPAT